MKLETSSNQQLCTLGNPAAAGESQSSSNDNNPTVAMAEQRDSFPGDVESANQKVRSEDPS